jgi:hypothetical protein
LSRRSPKDYHFFDDFNAIVYKKSSHLEYYIQLFDKYQEVDVVLEDKIILSFKDQMLDMRSGDFTTFSRKT